MSNIEDNKAAIAAEAADDPEESARIAYERRGGARAQRLNAALDLAFDDINVKPSHKNKGGKGSHRMTSKLNAPIEQLADDRNPGGAVVNMANEQAAELAAGASDALGDFFGDLFEKEENAKKWTLGDFIKSIFKKKVPQSQMLAPVPMSQMAQVPAYNLPAYQHKAAAAAAGANYKPNAPMSAKQVQSSMQAGQQQVAASQFDVYLALKGINQPKAGNAATMATYKAQRAAAAKEWFKNDKGKRTSAAERMELMHDAAEQYAYGPGTNDVLEGLIAADVPAFNRTPKLQRAVMTERGKDGLTRDMVRDATWHKQEDELEAAKPSPVADYGNSVVNEVQQLIDSGAVATTSKEKIKQREDTEERRKDAAKARETIKTTQDAFKHASGRSSKPKAPSAPSKDFGPEF